MLDPIAVREMFHKWIDSLRSVREGGHVAIDGKTLRRSFDKASGAKAIHIVSAYMVREGLVLSQLKVAEKTNEITAIPDLLNLLNIEGATVTIDAMGCQRAIAEAIVANEAHYVLAVKENQPTLHEEIREFFEEAMNEEGSNRVQAVVLDTHQEHSTGHGRREIRTCSYSRDVGRIAQHSRWSGIAGVAMIERQRLDIRSKKASSEKSYFIVSDPTATAASVANAVRSHWGIENQVHWVLDTNFSEDQSRIRVGHAAENIAVFRHLVVNLLRRAFGKRHSIAKKRQHCAWDILRTAAVLPGREVSA
jgi:predicted transposase YbfD/YdcC